MKRLLIILFFIWVNCPNTNFAQSAHELTPEQQSDKMVANKIWKPFVLTGDYQAVDHKEINFSSLQKPVFIYVGQKSCVACSYEFPTWIELVKENPEVNFVYITPDDSITIQGKFGKYLTFQNLYVIPFSMDQLWDQNVAMVFPIKYFLNKSGIVVDAMSGGMIKDRSKLMQSWKDRLQNILANEE